MNQTRKKKGKKVICVFIACQNSCLIVDLLLLLVFVDVTLLLNPEDAAAVDDRHAR